MPDNADRAMARQLRGSTLLLSGRAFSIAITLAVQVLIVRALSQSEYGAFAYALAVVLIVEVFALLGLDRAVTRFVAIYHERQDPARLFGTIVLVLGTILAVGLAASVSLYALRSLIGDLMPRDTRMIDVMLVLIVLGPVTALDRVSESLMAVFGRHRAILLRKQIAAPLLKLGVVALTLVLNGDAMFLAAGYVLSGVIGLAISLPLLAAELGRLGLRHHLRRGALRFPIRETFSYALPLLSTDIAGIARNSIDAVLLGYFRGPVAVASLRAVQPIARLNDTVSWTFIILFMPQMARFFARQDSDGANHFYWQTALWQAVLSFPIFAVTFSLADVVTTVLFGQRYASSAPIVGLLAVGLYTSAALGPNGRTLEIFGRLRTVVVGNVAAAGLNLGLLILFIPRYGAFGAAMAGTIAYVGQNLYYQIWLPRGAGIQMIPQHVAVYAAIIVATLVLAISQLITDLPILVRVVVAIITSVGVLWSGRSVLNVADSFPEVARIPVLSRFFASSSSQRQSITAGRERRH
jgi:O-antigen/teichoic acid export membrane protein